MYIGLRLRTYPPDPLAIVDTPITAAGAPAFLERRTSPRTLGVVTAPRRGLMAKICASA
jgi:hypothetical protein